MSRVYNFSSGPAVLPEPVLQTAQQEFVDWHYGKSGRLAEIEAQVLEDQAVDLLLAGAVVEDKPMSFQELMQPAPRAA